MKKCNSHTKVAIFKINHLYYTATTVYQNAITTQHHQRTYTVIFVRLELELFRQRENLMVLLQEWLAVFALVEIAGLWSDQRQRLLLGTTCVLLCCYSDGHDLTEWNVIAVVHRLSTCTTQAKILSQQFWSHDTIHKVSSVTTLNFNNQRVVTSQTVALLP